MYDDQAQTLPQPSGNGFEASLDSLHTLPLSIMPLQSPGLLKATMIKNARLESVIEMFHDAEAGSGQINLADIPNFFENQGPTLREDIAMLEMVGALKSFDVFSLRSELRRINVGFEDFGALALSDSKMAELTTFMRDFTRPLITRIYGSNADVTGDLSQIVDMLASPDRATAIRALKTLAEELEISITEVPAFLKQYGDVFLSLSYYRQCLTELTQGIPEFLRWMEDIRDTSQIRSDPAKGRMMDVIRNDLIQVARSIGRRFDAFDAFSKTFWEEVSAESFRMFGATVTAQHVGIGAMLCGLTVKMLLWRERFPNGAGLPMRRIEFLSSEILPGLENIKAVQNTLDRSAVLN